MDNWKYAFLDRQALIAEQCRHVAVSGFTLQLPQCARQEQGNNIKPLINISSSYRRRKASSAQKHSQSFVNTFTCGSMNKKCMDFCICTKGAIGHSQGYLKVKARSYDLKCLCLRETNVDESLSQAPQQFESNMEGSENIIHPHEPGDFFDSKVPKTMGESMISKDSHSAGQGTLQGAIGLIAGTSVGAGILALPARTMPVGFVPTTVTMVICWCFLVLEALIIAEINVALLTVFAKTKSKRNSSVVSLCTMAEETLGPLGGLISALIYCFLSYILMVAYISRSGDLLAPLMHISPSSSCWIFTLLTGGLVFFGGTNLADLINQILTAGLIGFFILIIIDGATIANWSGLEFMDWERTPQTFPVIVFSLVYHDLMPVLGTYLKGDIGQIRKAILLGSAIPLIMFVSWDAVIFCIAPMSGNEDPLAFLIRLGGTRISLIIEIFSILAVATSFIGTLLGFMEFFIERLTWKSDEQSYKNKTAETLQLFDIDKWNGTLTHYLHNWWMENRLQITSFILILAPPLAASIMVSDAFFSATDLAGGYGMTALFGIFPPAMAWSLHDKGLARSKDKTGLFFALPKATVKTVLAGTGACALGIILSQIN